MDENSSQAMGEAMQALEVLRGLTDALVIVVHHTGKNSAQGMRGSSALKAGADVVCLAITPVPALS